MPPISFIPLAEASGSILRLGGWVLREATREAAAWPASAGTVSVNVSARQVECGLLPSQVAAALAASGLPAARLELELTESLVARGNAGDAADAGGAARAGDRPRAG